MRSIRLFVSVLVFVLAAAAFAQTQPQQPQPPQLTWVRFFNVDFTKGEEWAAYQKKTTGAVFDRLISEGKIAGWGMATPFVLSGQNWTHVIWATMPNWSGADAIASAFESAMSKMTPAEMSKEMEMMRVVKEMPRDVVLRHLAQSTTPPTASAPALKYLRLSYFVINPGRSDDALALFREIEPRYAELAKRGTIGAYGFSAQELVTDPSWTHMFWLFTSEMSRLDDVRSSVMPILQNLMPRMAVISDPTKSRQEVLRVTELKIAPPRPQPR